MTDIDAIIIGAGVIGLATARELAMRGLSVIILESEKEFGSATSSRNSEVIHAGLYYPAGSLKARLCVEGREQLYAFCQSHGVPHRRCGKLIVAADEAETTLLAALKDKGYANGCDDLELIDERQALSLEPALTCAAALISPSTGIIDSHGYMLALLGDAEDHGAALALNAPFERAEATGNGFRVHVGGKEPQPDMPAARQLRRPSGADGSKKDRGLAGARHTGSAFRQGQLFFAYRQIAVFTAHLPCTAYSRPWRAFDA